MTTGEWQPEDLKAWRDTMAWSQQQAAIALGLARESYVRNESGRHPIDRRTALSCLWLMHIKGDRDRYIEEIAELEAGLPSRVTRTEHTITGPKVVDDRDSHLAHLRRNVAEIERILSGQLP